LDTNHLVASAYDLPNQTSLGSARIFSFDGPKYVPVLAPAGNGAFVTNLNASALASGTVADARLSSNVALRAGGNNFTGNQAITSGNLGIGTGSPVTKLNVLGDGASVQVQAATAGNSSYLAFFDSAQAVEGLIGVDGNGFSGTPNQFSIAAWSTNPIGFFTSASQRMTIGANGNVGVGTTTPNFPLSFGQTLGDKLALWDDGNGQYYGFGITNFGLQIHADTSLADIIFGYGSSSNLTETMRIKGNGNVGIDTTTPVNNLQVGNQLISAVGYGLQVNSPTYGADIQINNSSGLGLVLHNYAGGNAAMLQIRNGSSDTAVFNAYGNGSVYAASFNPTSDRNAKENFQAVSPEEVLAKVSSLSIQKWNFQTDTATTHIGPMAQDFYAAFGVGPDDKHISTVDADGVALAAIQGLNQKLGQKETEISDLKRTVEELKQLMKVMNQRLNRGRE
jgi:hypothetical protein